MLKKYKLTLAYDGSQYSGWQAQPGKKTIVQTLQDTFKKTFGSSIIIEGASRTDAGVHALGQVASFTTECLISSDKLKFAWNNILGQTISILDLQEVPLEFHPRKSRERKTYRYYLFIEQPLPFWAPYGWYIGPKLSLERLQEALQIFVGTHDFRAFCAESADRNTIKTIEHISVDYVSDWKAYKISITGNAFLRHMIRRLVGAAVMVGLRSEITVQSIYDTLQARNANNAFVKAPAQGLFLQSIEYKQ